MQRIVILGAGTGGTIMANRIAKAYRGDLAAGEMTLTVVDQDDQHIYQPGLLFVPFGIYQPEHLIRPRRPTLPGSATYVQSRIDRVEPDANLVHLEGGRTLPYDLLIVASGTRILPEETEGLTGPGWQEKMFDFYTLEGASGLAKALSAFQGGRLVVNVVDMPIKCPVAPLEFLFLADWYFTRRGIRDKVTISYATPLDGAFTKPMCNHHLTHLLGEKGITMVNEFNTGSVDGPAGRLIAWDEREVPFDLLVTIPLHGGAAFVGRSPGLGDDLGFVRTHPNTLQSERAPNIFAIGDATNLPASKAGSVAHFESEVLIENVKLFLDGQPLHPGYDGHANCFIETGFDKALLVDFNYEVEPLPGKFPVPVLGPMTLMEESRINHLGKMAFKWVYWNMLLPGRDIPMVGPRMSMAGKHAPEPVAALSANPNLERHPHAHHDA
ncbi:MAG TPA: FAD/NAD(P)-binding oxidoreductase [Gemmatimonadales bacterium]